MSIYCTLWRLQFPRFGDDHIGCDWVEVWAQGVPPHIGVPSADNGYEDAFADFLPPPLILEGEDDGTKLRAVVFVRAGTPKDYQRYVDPLLTITGDEYEQSSFDDLHRRICDALRGSRPRVIMQTLSPNGTVLVHEDGSTRKIPVPNE